VPRHAGERGHTGRVCLCVPLGSSLMPIGRAMRLMRPHSRGAMGERLTVTLMPYLEGLMCHDQG
jgi:hypothetical protein